MRMRHVGRYSKEDEEIGGMILKIIGYLLFIFFTLGATRTSDKFIGIITIVVWICNKIVKYQKKIDNNKKK